MFKILAAGLTVILLGIAGTAGAADPGSQPWPTERYEAACSAAGFQRGEVDFRDCVSTLKQTTKSLFAAMNTNMATKACILAGLPIGSEQLAACVDKINTGVAADTRSNG